MARLNPTDAAARARNELGRDFSEALARGLQIMNVFGPNRDALALSEIARIVDLPRATVRRSLLTLVQLGYAREDGRLFRLTAKVLELASAYLASSASTTILQPMCESLSAKFGESVSVAVLDQDDAVMVAYARPRRAYLDSAGIGLRVPAFCSAVGRVLLAGLPLQTLDSIFTKLDPRPLTDRTVTNKVELAAIIEQVRHQGFALADEEVEIGYRSLAVPLRNQSGTVVFALNVGMVGGRGTSEEMCERFLACLIAEADLLRQYLL
jgi:IclR family pca regulon transcriptional regulator